MKEGSTFGSKFTSGDRNQAGELSWITNDYDAALAKAKAENKPIFIDFTGYTCTNCRWMEANMFTKPDVKREFGNYILVRLYTDGEGKPYEDFQKMQEEKFSTVALPFYAIVKADGEKINTFPGLTRNESEFTQFLQNAAARN
jgi:thiol:disulfide interchange protein DsbD